MRDDPSVAYVEPDKTVRVTEQTLPYGIDLIDADTSSTGAGDGAGDVSNVNAYIIDTGVDKDHPDLNVVNHVSFHGQKNVDCNDHGTHVAGTLAAKDNDSGVVGVAPGAPLTGVKVLGCNGSGRTSDVIKGVDWATEDNASKPAIANMSLGGRASDALDAAVKRSADGGIFYAVAAGNEGRNACKKSPARAGAGTDNGIMTTAATNKSDKEAYFSNYGRCVDVWAPGVNVLSTWMGGTKTISGTSMASPHVGGMGALYLSTHAGATPSACEKQIKADVVAPGTRSRNRDRIEGVYAGDY